MRLPELAKELRLTSKQLVTKLHEIGVEVKSHMAILTDEQTAKVRQTFAAASAKPAAAPKLAPRPSAAAGAKPGQLVLPSLVARRSAAIQRNRAVQTAAAEAVVRRTARAPSSTAAAAIAARMRRGRPGAEPVEAAPAPQPPPTAKPVAAPPAPAPPRGPAREQAPSRQPARPVAREAESKGRPKPDARRQRRGGESETLIVPTIEVMKLDERPARARRRGGRGRTTTAKRGEPGRARRTELDGLDRIAPSFIIAAPVKRTMRPKGPRPAAKPAEPKIVRIFGDLTVAQFAHKTGIGLGDIMKSLMTNHGQMLTINQTLPIDLAELLSLEFGVEVEVVPESDELDVATFLEKEEEPHLAPRPPVVTIMGHVDHGKTSLLDVIRKTNVAAGEAGGITQHIGAYHVQTPRGVIVFLDTPGHEAFTAMRARGAQVTDIVVLVAAVDDPLMPQAVEAINHAREAGVPIIVALNKVDLPGANTQRVMNDLMSHGLLSEAQGGDTLFVQVSAKKQTGITELLDTILLQAEMLELNANPERKAMAVVVESFNDPQRGATCTVLVQKGTLRAGDYFVVGQQSGRVKAMFDDAGRPIEKATPSIPVEIIGLDGVPEAGEVLLVMEDERTAREIAEKRALRRRGRTLESRKHVSLEGLKEMVDQGDVKELRLILKADVQGSLQAVRDSLLKIVHPEIKTRILLANVGGVNESDVTLADASDAVILAFNVRPDAVAAEAAVRQGIEIKSYQVIYHLLNDVRAAMAGMLEKKFKEIPVGRADVRQVFKVSKLGSVAGSYVSTGEARRTAHARLLRNNVVVYNGKVANLRRYKDDVSSVAVGLECGIGLENFNDIKEGDELEFYELEELPAEI